MEEWRPPWARLLPEHLIIDGSEWAYMEEAH